MQKDIISTIFIAIPVAISIVSVIKILFCFANIYRKKLKKKYLLIS